jgi:hypothetical protein
MKISDIFRQVADAIDQADSPGRPDPQLQNPAELSAVAGPYGDEVAAPDNQDAGAEDDVMVPPLQLKMELLKRAVGVDNIYDEGEPRADEADNGDIDLARMKQMAGIPVAAVSEMSDDDIIDN